MRHPRIIARMSSVLHRCNESKLDAMHPISFRDSMRFDDDALESASSTLCKTPRPACI
jgi:hypothetical protein